MTDIVEKLRNPPVMSMALNSDDLSRQRLEIMQNAADEIERLRSVIRAAQVFCEEEECENLATFTDNDSWYFCSTRCMEKMEERWADDRS